MSTNPVSYAECTLGVHEVYKSALSLSGELTAAKLEVIEAIKKKRELNDLILDREGVLTIEERGANSGMSASAFETHLRAARRNDPQLMIYRQQLRSTQSDLDVLDSKAESYKTDLEILKARMVELSGYLNYLAAAKNAQTHKKDSNDGNSSWPSVK